MPWSPFPSASRMLLRPVQCPLNPNVRHRNHRSLHGPHVLSLFLCPHRCLLRQLRQTDQVRWLLWEVPAPADALPVLPGVLLTLQLCLPELDFPERVRLRGWSQRRCTQDAESPPGITGGKAGLKSNNGTAKREPLFWRAHEKLSSSLCKGQSILASLGLLGAVLLRRANLVAYCL